MDAALLSLPVETLQSRLDEAMAALHKLAIGGRAVSVSIQGGRAAAYSQANINDLKGYIADLQGALAAKQTGRSAARGPIYLVG
jgi:hypothetical protein